MVAVVEDAQDNHLHDHARERGRRQGRQQAEQKAAGQVGHGGGHVGPDHVQGAVGQVDDPHDPEDQRQPGGHEKEHHAELEAVEELFDEKQH